MARIICLQCGNPKIVFDSRLHQQYCCYKCYWKSLELDEKQMIRLSTRFKGNRRKTAEFLDMPYVTFYCRLKRQKLNHLFQKRGGWYHGQG